MNKHTNITQKKKQFNYFFSTYDDKILIITAFVLLIFGSIMVVSASVGLILSNSNIVFITMIKQIIFTITGYLLYWIMTNFFSIQLAAKLKWVLIVGIIIALFIPLFFDPINGSQAWIPILNIFTLQPSEFSKIIIMVLFGIGCYEVAMGSKKKEVLLLETKYPLYIFLIVVMFIIVAFLQKDFGSAIVMAFIAFFCFFIPNDRSTWKLQKWLGWASIIGMMILILLLVTPLWEVFIELLPLADYQKARFVAAFNPFYDPYGSGYQLSNALFAFASGGLGGLGFGNSIQKYGYLPEAHTDYILAIIVEELGIFGLTIVVVCYGVLLYRLYKYARKSNYLYEKVILIGMASYFFIHFTFNIGGVIGFIPLTGVPLLLVSAGGSSVWAVMMGLGICQSLIRKINRREEIRKLKEREATS